MDFTLRKNGPAKTWQIGASAITLYMSAYVDLGNQL